MLALNVQIKNVSKHELSETEFSKEILECNYYLLVAVVVSDVSDAKVMSSTVVVIFAVN